MKATIGSLAIRWCLAVVVLLGLSTALGAQVQFGAFSGTVTDPSDAVVPGADVTVTNLGTNLTYTYKTNDSGGYRTIDLPPGRYKMEASASGFKTQLKTNITLSAGSILRVDFKLEVGQKTETMTVEAGAILVSTEDSKLSETVGAAQVANLPLNGRNVFDLIRTAPGAVDVRGVSFENGNSTVVNGLRPNFTGFLINGVSNKGLSGGVVTTPNPDIVEEFQMLTLNMSAQYGNSASAIANLVTKSGTNNFHGSAYYFFRGEGLDANDFFYNKNRDPLLDPSELPLSFKQFGGSFTGPIVKDHWFFTASYQGERFTTSGRPVPISVEAPQWRAAVIAAYPNSVARQMYQQFPTSIAGSTIDTVTSYIAAGNSGSGFGAFADFMCDANYVGTFTTLATRFAQMFGVTAADQTALAAGGCTVLPLQAGLVSRTIPFMNETTAVFSVQSALGGNLFNGNEWSGRIDWVGKNDRVFGEYYWLRANDRFGPSNSSSGPRGFLNPQDLFLPNLQLNWVHTLGPTMVNEAKVGYLRNRNDIGVANPGVPSVGFDDGAAGFGSYNGYPQFFRENIYTYSEMFSYNHGKHSMKFGAEFRRNIENSEFNVARPSYYFFDNFFFALDAPYGMVAGVDPGFAGNNPPQLQSNVRAWRNLEFGAFFQDDWKVSRNLTINVGVRYDIYGRHTEKFGRVTTFIPGPTALTRTTEGFLEWISSANVPAGTVGQCDQPQQIARVVLAGVCGPGGFAGTERLGGADHNNVGPRLGMAWDPFGKGKTSIRAGVGVSYEGTLYNPLSNSRWNPPYYSFNNANNSLVTGAAGGDYVVYGPTTCTATTCTPTGAPVIFTGAGTNPGMGLGGAQATGNVGGWAPFNTNQAILTGIVFPQGIKDPFVTNYYLSFQHEFFAKTVFEVTYVGTRGDKLFRAEQANRVPGGRLPVGITANVQGRTLTGLGRLRLNPNYGNLRVWANVSESWYDGLQVAIRKQMSHGFMINANYSWSHSLDTGSSWHSGATSANGAAGGDGYSSDHTLMLLDKGNSIFDIRHRLTFNYVWELPWLKDQKSFAGKMFGGWQWNGIWTFQSGAHWSAFDPRGRNVGSSCSTPVLAYANCINTGGDYNMDGTANDRPNAPNGINVNASHCQWGSGFFGATCGSTFTAALSGATPFFARPCVACNGNLPRNSLVGPGMIIADMSIFKNFAITEQMKIQFRFEMFNAFNRVNFRLPNGSTGGNNGNRVNNSLFGQSDGTQGSRNIQIGFKFLF